MSDQTPTPTEPTGGNPTRPGRARILVLLVLAGILLLIGIYNISTRELDDSYTNVLGGDESQRIYGGLRQMGDRLGEEDAQVQIQVFTDVQAAEARDNFLETIPPLAEDLVRRGEVKLFLRNRSITRNATELAFYGVEAAAKQNYGWQYADLMVRNQKQAEAKGQVDRDFLLNLAKGLLYMDLEQWEKDFDEGLEDGSAMTASLEEQDKLAISLGIRAKPAMVVTGPRGTKVLQDGPDFNQIKQAVDAVR